MYTHSNISRLLKIYFEIVLAPVYLPQLLFALCIPTLKYASEIAMYGGAATYVYL